ncbi:MAG: C39 family peptidase [Anaerolineales bacterium]|nr:C39 family peptidase [Anaerolineales bacterium]
MGRIIPSIPYKSQVDADADDNRNDCGPTALAMVLNAFGHNVTTNAVYKRTGAKPNAYVSVTQLMNASRSYGIPFNHFYAWNLTKLKQMVNQGKTMIALVHYGSFVEVNPGVSTQNTSFTGPHFVVVVAYDDDHIYVNDPLWWGSRRSEGFRKAWTYNQFLKAWGSNHIDGNKDFSGILCSLTLSTEQYNGPDDEPVPPPFQLDPDMARRIKAWAEANGLPQPAITSPAVANAYIEAMGAWGERVVEHQVTAGDTPGLIALRYYDDPMKWNVIMYFNGLTPVDVIHAGDKLLIPEPLTQPVEIPDDDLPDDGVPPVLDITQPNPDHVRRIRAWAAYHNIEQPDIPNNQVAAAYLTALGDWGTEIVKHTVADGEDLGLIALKYYGNPLKWDVITQFNRLPPVGAFKVGDVLEIPEPDRI